MSALPLILVALSVLILALLGLIWMKLSAPQEDSKAEEEVRRLQDKIASLEGGLSAMQKSISGSDANLQNKMDAFRDQLQKSLEGTGAKISAVEGGIAQVKQSAEDFKAVGTKLQEVLTGGTKRGGFGEQQLEAMLRDVFPDDNLRFQFPPEPGSPDKVDAAVVLEDKLIPIDSKFPTEDFLRIGESKGPEKVKARNAFLKKVTSILDTIEAKYIRPPHTYEVALMYIPSEGIYQEASQMAAEDETDLFSLARQKKVILSSPQTLYMHLRLILSILKSQKLSANVERLQGQLATLHRGIGDVKEAFSKAKKQLGQSANNFGAAEAALGQFEADLEKITSIGKDQNGTPPAIS